VLPEEGQELRPKQVGALINENTVQEFGVKYVICNIRSSFTENTQE